MTAGANMLRPPARCCAEQPEARVQNGKVKRRRREGWNGAAAERPSRNRRRKGRRSLGVKNAARDERAFLRNGTGAVVRGSGRTVAGEVEQESALVTAEPNLFFSNNASGFFHERMLKGTGIGVERDCLETQLPSGLPPASYGGEHFP